MSQADFKETGTVHPETLKVTDYTFCFIFIFFVSAEFIFLTPNYKMS